MPSDHDLLGKTVKSNQQFWYEVHESRRDDADIHLVAVDSVPNRHISVDELEERMAGGWELVYEGVTGDYEPADEHEDEQLEPGISEDLGAENAESWISGGPR